MKLIKPFYTILEQGPGMTYEEGVKAGIEWVLGQTDDHPLEDE